MYKNGPLGLLKKQIATCKGNLSGFLQRSFKLLFYCLTWQLPFCEIEEIYSNAEVGEINVNAFLILVLPFCKTHYMTWKVMESLAQEVFYSTEIGCWTFHVYSRYRIRYTLISCSGLLYRHIFPLIIPVAITSQYQLFFLPWSRSSVIILLVWFQVLSINIIFFSLVPSLLLLEMHSFRFFSSLGSIFACLRRGSPEQSLSLSQTLFLVYFWRWKAMSFTETESGPGNISAI